MQRLTNSHEGSKFKPKGIINQADVRRARNQRLALVGRLAAYCVGGALLALLVTILLRPRAACRETPERERALATLLEKRDPRTGQSLAEQLEGARFTCADSFDPRGVLVATADSAQPAIIWFVDESRTLHNVNLLSAAYTPDLAAAPAFDPAQLADVQRAAQE